jgi:uncharacterized protein (TIGR02996 family)
MLGTDKAFRFPYFLEEYAESNLAPPRTERQLHNLIRQHWIVEGEVLCQPGAIQVLDNDDELEFAFYIFDDAFARKYPERTEWFMQEDWRLPTNVGTGGFRPLFPTQELLPRGRWTGTTYVVIFSYYDSLNLTDVSGGASRLAGVRLPQLARWFATNPPHEEGQWGTALEDIAEQILAVIRGARAKDPTERAFLRALREKPGDDGLWEVFGDWLEEHGRPRTDWWLLESALQRISEALPGRHSGDLNPKRKGNLSKWHVTSHLAQLCLHTASYGQTHLFAHWVLFDDVWASAHPALANSVLRQNDRWDVLSSPRRRRTE